MRYDAIVFVSGSFWIHSPFLFFPVFVTCLLSFLVEIGVV